MAVRLLEDFAEIASDWFWEMDENYRFSYFSSSLQKSIGVNPQQEIGKSRIDIAANAANKDFWQPHIDDLLNHRTFRNFTYPYQHKDGKLRWLSVSGQPVFDAEGKFRGYRGVGSDITAEQEARDQLATALQELQGVNSRLEEQNLLFETAIDNISQGLCMFDEQRRLIVCNQRYSEMYGLPGGLTEPGTHLRDILAHRVSIGLYSGSDPEEYIRKRLELVATANRAQTADELNDGRIYLVTHGQIPLGGSIAIHEDITERRRAEDKISHMARHDALTGLPNRTMLREKLEEALVRAREGAGFAVLCLDLDNFKTVNDSMGHPAGDALLQAVTRRLEVCVRDTDTVARLGGDEFAILQCGMRAPEDSSALARRIIEVLSAPFTLEEQQVVVGVSIGIALAPGHGKESDHLLKCADMALYRAKDSGRRTFRFFEAEMDAHQQRRRALEVDLRRALIAGEFELFYQPIVSLVDGSVYGLEALLRWRHPERGLLGPNEFVELCEEIGLIVPLGDWVLRTACRDVARLSDEMSIAVNMSPAQFRNPQVVGSVLQALHESRLDPARLELEITESVMLLESDETLSALHKLRDLGVRISMDDFGTGYSSLSYLRRFPFDRIKIDRSFIADLEIKDDCRAIIRAVAGLARDLGIATTAEGVETSTQLKALLEEGLTGVQGYLFSPPLPLDEIVDVLARVDEAEIAAA